MRVSNPLVWRGFIHLLILEYSILESSQIFLEAFKITPPFETSLLLAGRVGKILTVKKNKREQHYGFELYGSPMPQSSNDKNSIDKYKKQILNEWGTYYSTGDGNGSHPKQPIFPCTFASVSKAACDAITSSLYQQSRPDPNIVSNAMSQSVFHYRPVRNAKKDAGRIGVEIDGARFLVNGSASARNGVNGKKDYEQPALARLALLIASNLSERPWKNLEDEANADRLGSEMHRLGNNTKSSHDPFHEFENSNTRPIVVYFSSLGLTLRASRELQYLKDQYEAHIRPDSNKSRNHHLHKQLFHSSMCSSSPFDNIRICCLGQDDIPVDMLKYEKNPSKSKKSRGNNMEDGYVDPTKGILLIVQPSSTYGTSSFSPEAHDTKQQISTPPPIESLQKIITQATLYQIPTVLLSPRLDSSKSSTQHNNHYSSLSSYSSSMPTYRGRSHLVTANRRGGLASSAYQHSETYGGSEPPRPSPWLLRDYCPPVFVWVTTSCYIKTSNDNENNKHLATMGRNSFTTRIEKIGLLHSVMDVGHSWHLFTWNRSSNASDTKYGKYEIERKPIDNIEEFKYMASTKPSSGRPSIGIIETILNCHNLIRT